MVDLSGSIASFRAQARAILPEHGFETLFPEEHTHISWHANAAALQRWRLRPRILTGTVCPNMETSLLGTPVSMPIIAAPIGVQQRIHAEGEQAAAKGAGRADSIFCVSSLSTFSLREIAAQKTKRWYQLYLAKDRTLSLALVREAEANGFGAIILTVDNVAGFQVQGSTSETQTAASNREKAFWSVGHADPARALRVFADLPPEFDLQGAALADLVECAPCWADVAWLTTVTDLPVIVKGVQRVEDAILATSHGVKAIIVSNHGGASSAMDGVPSPLYELQNIALAVGHQIEIYYDGAVQNGMDVLKILALGAKAILIGRPMLWGLAVAGADGVEQIFEILKNELHTAMAICGVADVRAVPPSLIAPI